MERGRCGPLVVARSAPPVLHLRGTQESCWGKGYEVTCAVTRSEKVVSRE